MLRVCRAHGWTRAVFDALPDSEKVDVLAFDARRQQQLQRYYHTIRAAKYPDAPSLMMLILQMME